MKRQILPIGIQDLANIRRGDHYYVDKTPLIKQLVLQGRHYFLSRPRRFGKSLLLDTFHELFAGSEPLFRGLAIHDDWDWNEKYPVIKLSFDLSYNSPDALDEDVHAQLRILERNLGLSPSSPSSSGQNRFIDLIDRVTHSTGKQVVILIDEYDKPILDAIENPALAELNREYLRGLYGGIKGLSKSVRFVFVTGVSMFSKVSLFAGMNNLDDISLDPRYASICGYTESDLDTYFEPELEGLNREDIRNWYNGYSWRGADRMFNPFDILLLFSKREFRPYWFESGTPRFLIQLLMNRKFNPLKLESERIELDQLTKLDIDDIDIHALMFQSGYLTLATEEANEASFAYLLEFPNQEVRQSFTKTLLRHIGHNAVVAANQGLSLLSKLKNHDFTGFCLEFQSILSGVPYLWFESGRIGHYESFYAAMLYMSLNAAGVNLKAEELTSHGRSDLVLQDENQLFVFELKVVDDKDQVDEALDEAINQIRDREYARKYSVNSNAIHLISMVFGKKARNLIKIKSEPY